MKDKDDFVPLTAVVVIAYKTGPDNSAQSSVVPVPQCIFFINSSFRLRGSLNPFRTAVLLWGKLF